MPDRYELTAHYFPALINSVPFVLLGYYFLIDLDNEFFKRVSTASIGGVSLGLALYQLQVNLGRAVSKVIENKVFDSGKRFPTTELMLMRDNRQSSGRKEALVTKIKRDFGIDLKGRLTDTTKNRILINEAVSQIRTKMGRKNPLISQRNIQYGFARNVLGGSLLAIAASLLSIVLSLFTGNENALDLSISLLVMYTVLAVLMRFLLNFLGSQYAMALYDEYLSTK